MRNVGISLANNIASSISQTYGPGPDDVLGRTCAKLSFCWHITFWVVLHRLSEIDLNLGQEPLSSLEMWVAAFIARSTKNNTIALLPHTSLTHLSIGLLFAKWVMFISFVSLVWLWARSRSSTTHFFVSFTMCRTEIKYILKFHESEKIKKKIWGRY